MKLSGWLRRKPEDAAAPPAAEVLRKVRALELRTRGLVESLFSGEHTSMFHGRGLDFSHVRAYNTDDDVRAIDWKVTARRGSAYTRQFVEERDLLVVLVIDVSGSGKFGPGDRSAAEVAAEVAAALTFTATRSNDRVALLLVSDRVEHYQPPGSGKRHAVRLLADILSFRPRSSGTDLTPGLEHVAKRINGRAIVFLISDLIQRTDPRFRLAAGIVARVHDLVVVRLASTATDELPDVGWVELTDPESGRRIAIDSGSSRVRERYRRSVHRAHADMAALLTDMGAELVEVNTGADPLAALAEFFRRRQRSHR